MFIYFFLPLQAYYVIANHTETRAQYGVGLQPWKIFNRIKKQPKPLANSSKTEHSFLLWCKIKLLLQLFWANCHRSTSWLDRALGLLLAWVPNQPSRVPPNTQMFEGTWLLLNCLSSSLTNRCCENKNSNWVNVVEKYSKVFFISQLYDPGI